MPGWIEIPFLLLSVAFALPVAFLAFECLISQLPSRTRKLGNPLGDIQRRIALVIPAHNEEQTLPSMLESLSPELRPGDRVLVVADNCTDGTAQVARTHGANCAVRCDLDQRGKGYAMDFGVRQLSQDPPEVVIFIDADARIVPGTIHALYAQVIASRKPAQAVYLMEKPAKDSAMTAVSAFAFMVKNLVRPLGLYRLGMPCLLSGNGMAIPWHAITTINLASGNIVEDMKMGIDLAIAGHAPMLCTDARILSVLPSRQDSAFRQRTRWEHGHLLTLLTQAPRLVWFAVTRFRPRLLILAMELAVPPLSALIALLFLLLGAFATAAVVNLTGWTPATIVAMTLGVLIASIGLTWVRFGRHLLPLSMLLLLPLYVISKIPIYCRFLVLKRPEWIRTDREQELPTGEDVNLPAGRPENAESIQLHEFRESTVCSCGESVVYTPSLGSGAAR